MYKTVVVGGITAVFILLAWLVMTHQATTRQAAQAEAARVAGELAATSAAYWVIPELGCGASVTITGANGTSEEHEVEGFWTYAISEPEPGQPLFVSARSHCDHGLISVQIWRGLEVLSEATGEATGSGAFVTADASGTY